MHTPFKITVLDKAFARVGWIGNYESFGANLVHNGIGSLDLTLAADHPRIVDMMAPGARLAVDYGDDFLMSGPVTNISGRGPASLATVDFTIEDDYRILTKLLAWPNPDETIFNQGYDDAGEDLGDYDRLRGPAETVLKGFVHANKTRLGLPITIAPDQGRGTDIDIRMRFHPIGDERLMRSVEQAGLGVTVKQVGATLVLDVYEPVLRQTAISEAAGTLLSWSWNRAAPTNTRVVVGGQGEGIDRDFRLLTDAARETEWGPTFITEQFRDARDVELGNYALLDKRGLETLAEGGPTAGLKLTLSETPTFRYGTTVLKGDQVTVAVNPGVEITDVLRTASLTHTESEGFLVTPAVGDVQDASHDMLVAKAVARLAQGIRDIRTGR